MTRSTLLFLFCLLTAPVVAAPPATLTGKVVSVHDGDTLTVLDATKTQHKVRLHGIDAPETKQAFGTVARKGLADQVFGKVVDVEVVDKTGTAARWARSTSAVAT